MIPNIVIKKENEDVSLICINELFQNNSRSSSKHIDKDTNIIFGNELTKTNTVHESSQLNNQDLQFLLNLINNDLDCPNLNSQDEQKIIEITKKNMRHLCNIEELNTQEFISLNLKRALELQQNLNQQNSITKPDNENSDSNDSYIYLNSLEESQQNINNLNVLADTSTAIDLDLFNHDPEIINFRAMCKSMSNTKTVSKIPFEENNSFINNQVKSLIFKQVNSDELRCLNDMECVPSTSKSNILIANNYQKNTYDNSKKLDKKRPRNKDEMLDNLSENSLEYDHLNLSQNKKAKITALPIIPTLFECNPNGEIHKDMLQYIKQIKQNKVKHF